MKKNEKKKVSFSFSDIFSCFWFGFVGFISKTMCYMCVCVCTQGKRKKETRQLQINKQRKTNNSKRENKCVPSSVCQRVCFPSGLVNLRFNVTCVASETMHRWITIVIVTTASRTVEIPAVATTATHTRLVGRRRWWLLRWPVRTSVVRIVHWTTSRSSTATATVQPVVRTWPSVVGIAVVSSSATATTRVVVLLMRW